MTAPVATVITPIGNYHTELAPRAIASAREQTAPCTVMPVWDENGRGPGFCRNRALERVETPFVVFLDADDAIEPTFVERCLSVWKPGRYVYTDWLAGDKVQAAPAKPWCGGAWHVITTLVPTEYALGVGGFDEELPGAEDTDFHLKLITAGVCGIHVAEPLFLYGAEGVRAKEFVGGAHYQPVMQLLSRRYKGMSPCCGDEEIIEQPPAGQKAPGDVLAQAVWDGNRVERGLVTRRLYPRTGNGKVVWVNAEDVSAAPHHWRLYQPPVDKPQYQRLDAQPLQSRVKVPSVHGVEGIAAALHPGSVRGARVERVEQLPALDPVQVTPDVSKVMELAKHSKRG